MHAADILPWRHRGRGIEPEAGSRPNRDEHPFGAVQADVDRAFQRFWNVMPIPLMGKFDPELLRGVPGPDSWDTLPVDVQDTGDAIKVEAEVPGFEEGEIDLYIGTDGLTLRAEHKSDRRVDRRGFLIQERDYGRLERVVPLGPGVDPEAATATLSNGILTVVIPKTVPTRENENHIPIQTA